MTSQSWSWALTLLGVSGLWLAGSNRRAGWLVGIAAQCLWVPYAIGTRQWGFLVSAAAYGIVHARNWRRWVPPAPTTTPSGQIERGAGPGVVGHTPAGLPVAAADIIHAAPAADGAAAAAATPRVPLSVPPPISLTTSPAALLALVRAVLGALGALHADSQPRTCVEVAGWVAVNVLDAYAALRLLCDYDIARVAGPDRAATGTPLATQFVLARHPDVARAARSLAAHLPPSPGSAAEEVVS